MWRYFLATLACAGELLAYSLICTLLGWKNFGGYLIFGFFFFGLVAWTWRVIARPRSESSSNTKNSKSANDDSGIKPRKK